MNEGLKPGPGDLRSLLLGNITHELGLVAANWYRLTVERLPIRGKTLDTIRKDYFNALSLLPNDSSAEEIETLMRNCASAMNLREGRTSKTQIFFANIRLVPESPLGIDEAYVYYRKINLYPGSIIHRYTTEARIYMEFHLRAGTLYPTFDEGLQAEMCVPEIQRELVSEGPALPLDPLVRLHSRWIAKKLAEAARPEDTSDFSQYGDSETQGSWIEDLQEDSPDSLTYTTDVDNA